MENILDNETEPIKPQKKLFSWGGLIFAIASIVLGGVMMWAMDAEIKVEDQSSRLSNLFQLALVLRVTIILGFLCSIISLLRKESPSPVKFWGAVLNGIFFLLIMAAILFALKMDGRL